MESCITCELYARLDNVAVEFARAGFAALETPVSRLFGSILALWMVWQIGIKALVTGDFELRPFVKQLFFMIVTAAVLESLHLYWDWVFDTARSTTSGLAQVLVNPIAGQVGDVSILGLLDAVETEVKHVGDNVRALVDDAGWRLWRPLAGLLLMVPFFFVWAIFLAYVLEGLFKLMAVSALAPLFIAIAPFQPLRGFSISAIRVALGGMLTVVFAAVAMGFTMMAMRYYTGALPLQGDRIDSRAAADFLFSNNYFALLIIAFISILFHLKAATLASNISGALDGPGAAAAVSGAMTGAGAAFGRYALRTAQRLPKANENLRRNLDRYYARARGG